MVLEHSLCARLTQPQQQGPAGKQGLASPETRAALRLLAANAQKRDKAPTPPRARKGLFQYAT